MMKAVFYFVRPNTLQQYIINQLCWRLRRHPLAPPEGNKAESLKVSPCSFTAALAEHPIYALSVYGLAMLGLEGGIGARCGLGNGSSVGGRQNGPKK